MLIGPDQLYPAGGGTPAFTLLDVRSPVEVARGALPYAHSLPLMSDEERHAVGIRYKEAGQEAAVALGFELAGPQLPARIAAWRTLCHQGPTAVACWRGGLRSRLTVELIGEPQVARVEGGYKAIRRHLMGALPGVLARRRLLVLGGLTGSGKTRLLREVRTLLAGPAAPSDPSPGARPGAAPAAAPAAVQIVDLEGEARHRGSAFGAEAEPQPSQQSFENALAVALLLGAAPTVVVEDESRFIGRRTLPPALLEAMARAPVVLLEAPLADRVQQIFEEYVRRPTGRFGMAAVRDALERNTRRLRKRIGGGRTDRVLAALRAAEPHWLEEDAHAGWIAELLVTYYDRLYHKVAASRERPVAFRGDAAAVRAYLTADGRR